MNPDLDRQSIDQLVLTSFPSPLAVVYRQLIEEPSWHAKTDTALYFFEIMMWSLDLEILRNYLDPLTRRLSDAGLDRELYQSLHLPSLGNLINYFFFSIGAHREHRDWFFMREEYDLYWTGEQKKMKNADTDFRALAALRNNFSHGVKPITDDQWHDAYRQVERPLLNVLSRLAFLQHYQVLCVLSVAADQASCISLRGLSPGSYTLAIPEGMQISAHSFYLRDTRDNRLTWLSPLFLPWPSQVFEGTASANLGAQNQLAMYAKYSRRKDTEREAYKILYQVVTAARKDEELIDQQVQSDFAEIIIRQVEMIRQKLLASRRLDWIQFTEVAADINQIEVQGGAGESASAADDLYYDRRPLRLVFEDFVRSSRTAMVLLGDAGVGKSTFLQALARHPEPDGQRCVIFLNSSKLSGEQDLVQQLTTLFTRRVRLSDAGGERKIDDILEELNGMPGIETRRIVIAFDALNENGRADSLLGRIDELAGYLNYPWLKLVVTSRPEAWENLKRRVVLTEPRYYHLADARTAGLNLDAFERSAELDQVWLKLGRLETGEVPLVYDRYRRHFSLTSGYQDLSLEMKLFLSDPLALKLIAQTYVGKALPENARVLQLYQDYLRSMIDQGKLERSDVNVFLEQRIVPLLFDSQGPRNRIDVETLSSTLDPDSGRPLAEKIEVADLVESTQRPVNRAFQNLADCGILSRSGTPSDYVIGFRYERFYDYFAGAYIFREAAGRGDKAAYYRDLIGQVGQSSFLWGAIKQALFKELVSGSQELVEVLAREPGQLARQLLITVLTELGHEPDGVTTASALVGRLLKLDRSSPGPLRGLRARLTGNDGLTLTPSAAAASRTAMEVARRLELGEVLEGAATDSSSMIRLTAVRNIYHYWRRKPDEGLAMLDRLVDRVVQSKGIPDIAPLESCLAAFILMLRHYQPDSPVGVKLGVRVLGMARRLVRRLLYADSPASIGQRLVVPALRVLVVDTLVRFVVRSQESYPEDKPSFLRELNGLLEAPPDVRSRYNRLVDYFAHPTSIQDIRADLDAAVRYNDTLTNGLCWLILVLEYVDARQTDYTLLEDLANLELQQPQVGSTNQGMIIALGLIGTTRKDASDELFQRLDRMTVRYVERTRGLYYSRDGTIHPNLAINPQINIRRLRQNPQDRDLCAYFLGLAREEKDWKLFTMLLDTLVTQVSNSDDLLNARMALESLRSAFPVPPGMEEGVIFTLARIGLYWPQEVENLLLEVDSANRLLPRVLRVEPDEQVWSELFHNVYSSILIRLLQTPSIKEGLAGILRQATRQKDLKAYLRRAVKQLMNLLVDEPIFRLE